MTGSLRGGALEKSMVFRPSEGVPHSAPSGMRSLRPLGSLRMVRRRHLCPRHQTLVETRLRAKSMATLRTSPAKPTNEVPSAL